MCSLGWTITTVTCQEDTVMQNFKSTSLCPAFLLGFQEAKKAFLCGDSSRASGAHCTCMHRSLPWPLVSSYNEWNILFPVFLCKEERYLRICCQTFRTQLFYYHCILFLELLIVISVLLSLHFWRVFVLLRVILSSTLYFPIQLRLRAKLSFQSCIIISIWHLPSLRWSIPIASDWMFP